MVPLFLRKVIAKEHRFCDVYDLVELDLLDRFILPCSFRTGTLVEGRKSLFSDLYSCTTVTLSSIQNQIALLALINIEAIDVCCEQWYQLVYLAFVA